MNINPVSKIQGHIEIGYGDMCFKTVPSLIYPEYHSLLRK